MSELVLLRRLDKLPDSADPMDPTIMSQARAIPTLADRLPATTSAIAAFLVLYGAGDEKPRLVLDLIRDGRLISRSLPTLPDADANGAIPFVATLPVAGLGAGPVEIRATVLDGDKGIQRSLFVTLD